MPPISAALFRQADAILDAVLDLPEHERDAFVGRACQDDRALRTLVDRLLRAQSSDHDLLSQDAAHFARALIAAPESSTTTVAMPLPEHIGSYRVLAELGRGGTAIVYLARHIEHTHVPDVAVKVLRDERHRSTDAPCAGSCSSDSWCHGSCIGTWRSSSTQGSPTMAAPTS